jgi:uncharacterized protein (TIGR03382 family)
MLDDKTNDHESHTRAKPAEGSAISSLLCALPIVLAGCLDSGPELGVTRSAVTVSGAGASGCSTAVVLGLSRQIADEISCEAPGGLVPFTASSSITLTSSAVLPYLEQDAADDLNAVAANHPLQINSAFRTIAQQYLLVRWHANGQCGIAAAAAVGNSNHESGRAVDLANWSSRVSNMAAHGWAHDVPGDVVHFDHTASPDIRGEDVTAFQTLWNRNNPGDPIAIDGAYGPQTEARLKASPATGFAQGASCVTKPHAEVTAVDGPDMVSAQAQAHYTLSLTNGSDTEWPDTAELQIVGDSSMLRDASWLSATSIAALGTFVPGGATVQISFDVTAPNVTDETPVTQQLQISDGTTVYGTASFALTIEPAGDPSVDAPKSDDGGDSHDLGQMTGGCSAGGGGTGVLALALVALVRRRRR